MIANALSALAALFVLANGPPDSLFEDLKNAPDEQSAEMVASDIVASWLESGSPTVDIMMERAQVAAMMGDMDTARDFLDRAIAIAPEYAEAWHQRAGLFFSEEKFGEALLDLNETLRLEPRHFAAWGELGFLFETLGKPDAALEAYDAALAIYPTQPEIKDRAERLRKSTEGRSL